MKKLLLFVVALSTLLLVSCSKESSLIGKWQAMYEDFEIYQNGELEESGREDYSGDNIVYEFETGGKGTMSSNEEKYTFSWTLSGKNLSLTIYEGGESETETAIVESVSNKELVLTVTEDETYNGIVYRFDSRLVFKKI